MEYWDVYDGNRIKTGRLHKRGVRLTPGDYHLIVNVWIKNSNDEYLIQQRQNNIPLGGKWTCAVGGSAIAGEDSLQAIVRELKEEIGVHVSTDELTKIYSCKDHEIFNDIFYMKKDINIEELSLQKEEVKAVKWVSADEIAKMIATNEFINRDYFTDLFKLI